MTNSRGLPWSPQPSVNGLEPTSTGGTGTRLGSGSMNTRRAATDDEPQGCSIDRAWRRELLGDEQEAGGGGADLDRRGVVAIGVGESLQGEAVPEGEEI